MTDAELELLIDRAAKKGAQEALRSIGLHDDDAIHDVRELRELLDAWRDAKKTVANTVAKTLTIAFLSMLAIGAYIKWGGNEQ